MKAALISKSKKKKNCVSSTPKIYSQKEKKKVRIKNFSKREKLKNLKVCSVSFSEISIMLRDWKTFHLLLSFSPHRLYSLPLFRGELEKEENAQNIYLKKYMNFWTGITATNN